jgi:hypothetical protein
VKKFLLISTLISFISIANGQLPEVYKESVTDFISLVKSKSKKDLSARVIYPLRRDVPLKPVINAEQFIERYEQVFDENLSDLISNSDPLKDWSAVGFRGIMLHNGTVWLDTDGNLIAVNYQSAFEAEKKAELILTEKSSLHESIKIFSEPVLIMETKKFLVRIDDLGSGNFRYASWPAGSAMSEKPSLILTNGEFKPDGSGGNHGYEFRNGKYLYVCDIVLLGSTESAPAYLTVYKGDKEILSQEAKMIR